LLKPAGPSERRCPRARSGVAGGGDGRRGAAVVAYATGELGAASRGGVGDGVTRSAHLLAGLVGVFFAGIGLAKVGGQFGLEDFLELGWPFWLFEMTGVVELFGGLALLWPRSRRAGALALLAVIAVLCWQPATHSYGPTAGGGVMITLLVVLLLSTVLPEADSTPTP